MATPYHSQCSQFKRYNLSQCTFLTKCIQIRNISPFLIRPSVRTGAPSPRGQCHQLKHQGTVYLCHCEERSDVAIRFLLGNMFEIGTLQGERIATPVCGLVRNDREIGPWFLKLMTLPPGGRHCAPTSLQTPIYRNRSAILKSSPKGIPHLISHISYLISAYPAPSAPGDRKGRPYADGVHYSEKRAFPLPFSWLCTGGG